MCLWGVLSLLDYIPSSFSCSNLLTSWKKKTNSLFLTSSQNSFLYKNTFSLPTWIFLIVDIQIILVTFTLVSCISETPKMQQCSYKIWMPWLLFPMCSFVRCDISIAKSFETKNATHSRTVRDSAVTLTSKGLGLAVFVLQRLFSTMIGVSLKCFRVPCVIIAAERGLKVLNQDYDGERRGHRWFTER